MNRNIFFIGFLLGLLYHVYALDNPSTIDSLPKQDDFMTEKEYGQYLYINPRGVSCQSCHGDYGKGLSLVTYTKGDKAKEIRTLDITNLDFNRFSKALNHSPSIMPRYYLTDSEIEAIYHYITSFNH